MKKWIGVTIIILLIVYIQNYYRHQNYIQGIDPYGVVAYITPTKTKNETN